MRAAKSGIVVLVVLALGVGGAGSASAQAPEFGRCVKQVAVEKAFHGKYSDAKCTVAVSLEEEAKKGRFEWLPGPGPKSSFTMHGGRFVLEHSEGLVLDVSCTAESATGEVVAGADNKTVTMTITLTGCKRNQFKCTTPGDNAGEVTSNPLVGEVNWLDKSKGKTALRLQAAPGFGGLLIDTDCLGEIRVKGGVLAPIQNAKMTEATALTYKMRKQGKEPVQNPTVWRLGEAGEESVALEGSREEAPYELAYTTLESTLQYEEPLELNPVL